jgi:hypothetical protein
MKFYDSLPQLLDKETSVVWIGAVSFESRCTGSVGQLRREGYSISRAIAFDYPTNLLPRGDGELNREYNRRELYGLLGTALELRVMHPYRYAEFVGELFRISNELSPETESPTFVIDITCLTKIHTIALAYWFYSAPTARVVLAYSQPELYGNPSKNTWGRGKWTSTFLVRLSLDSTEPYSSTSAIAILGHEGDRLRLALSEAEASEGLVIKVIPRDPASRLLQVSNAQNAWLFVEIENGIRQNFRILTMAARDLDALATAVVELVRLARAKKSRIVLCPFGPKPLAFIVANLCLSIYPENTWLSYPTPLSYDPEYSSGYKYTLWIDPSELSSSESP